MTPYSMDLLRRGVAACDAGDATREQIAARFSVSVRWVRDLLRRRRETGSIAPSPAAAANAVLSKQFLGVPLVQDVRKLKALPKVDLVVARIPCQDLSQAGKTAGIKGNNSGLVGEVFRLIQGMKKEPRWLLLENVPFMLQLDKGQAMTFLTHSLEEMGFRGAYRVADTQAFGLPQRRQRVLVLASKTEDPRTILFPDDAGPVHILVVHQAQITG